MSLVNVNKIAPSTGTTVTLGDASDVFQLPASAEIDIASGATLDVNGTLDVTGATVSGLSAGKVLQIVSAEYSADTSTQLLIPQDATIPQNTEGLELTTLSITPTSATSKLLVEWFSPMAGGSTDMGLSFALFQDSTAACLTAVMLSVRASYQPHPAILTHYMTSGTTSSTTFKIRMGPANVANTAYVNRRGSEDSFSTAGKSLFKITEYEA